VSNTRKASGGKRTANPTPWRPSPQGARTVTTPGPVPPASQPLPQDVIAMLEQRLTAMVQENIKDITALQAAGVTFDQGQVINARIDSLMHSVAMIMGPQGQAWELQAKIAFEEGMQQNIMAAQQQGRKAQLAQAGSFSASDIRQVARATGTYGGR
jgi:hypothetical protein